MLPCSGAHPLFGYGTPDALMRKNPKLCCEGANFPADVRQILLLSRMVCKAGVTNLDQGSKGRGWGLAEMVMAGSRMQRDVGRPEADSEERHDKGSKCACWGGVCCLWGAKC